MATWRNAHFFPLASDLKSQLSLRHGRMISHAGYFQTRRTMEQPCIRRILNPSSSPSSPLDPRWKPLVKTAIKRLMNK